MKKQLLITCFLLITFQVAFGQSEHKLSPADRKFTDTICNCVSKLDMSKIVTSDDAVSAYTECINKHMDLLSSLAEEKHVELTDQAAMSAIGVDLAKNLMIEKCESFLKISVLMSKKYIDNKLNSVNNVTTIVGYFKRIELKGFNYIILSDENHSEQSFIWLNQFPGSEKFMNGTAALTGKKLKVTSKEIEVFVPQAKGYYKIKEITNIEVL
jgi:hypothetical protein